jgi:Zn-dependent protease with chaperone function
MRGTCFAPETGGQRRGCVLSVFADRVEAVGEAGPAGPAFRISLPWSGARLELGGANGRMLFVHHGQRTVASEGPDFRSAVAESAPADLASFLRQMTQHRRQRRQVGWGLVALVLLILTALGALAWWGAQVGAAAAIDRLPWSVDEQLGDLAASHAPNDGVTLPASGAATRSVQALVELLAPHTGRAEVEWRPSVQQSETVNAYALPGGRLVFYTALIADCQRPEALAGVVAHEMAHVTLRHGTRTLAGRLGLAAGFQLLLGDAAGLVGLAGAAAEQLAGLSYSRVYELEADREGLRLLRAAGIDGQGMVAFFERMEARHGAGGGWWATHPANGERIAALRELLAESPSATAAIDLTRRLPWAAALAESATAPSIRVAPAAAPSVEATATAPGER